MSAFSVHTHTHATHKHTHTHTRTHTCAHTHVHTRTHTCAHTHTHTHTHTQWTFGYLPSYEVFEASIDEGNLLLSHTSDPNHHTQPSKKTVTETESPKTEQKYIAKE